MKQETLEEVSPVNQIINFITEEFQKEGQPRQLNMDLLKKWCEVKLLDEEIKWQQEISYSEEEVYDLMDKREHYWVRYKNYYAQSYIPFDEWFEQFKKK